MIWKSEGHIRGRSSADSSVAMISGDTASIPIHKSSNESAIAELVKVKNVVYRLSFVSCAFVLLENT